MIRRAGPIASLLWLGALGCREPATLEVRLHHAESLAVSEVVTELTIEIVAVGRPDAVARRTVTGGDLARALTLIEEVDLEDDRRYQIVARGEAPTACRLGRVVGRTPPFVLHEGAASVALMLGCADELAIAPDGPTFGRLAHVLVTDVDGRAVLVGGATRAEPSETDLGWRELPVVSELWDPSVARFVPGATTFEPRVLPGTLALPDGSIALVGGLTEGSFGCTTSIERLVGSSSVVGGPLALPRCAPAAVYLPAADRALVVGGAFGSPLDRTTDAELWDATLQTQIAGGLAATSFRGFGRAVPLRDGASALLAIGNPGGAPAVEVARLSGECGAAVCFEPVAGGPDPARAWSDATATWVSCARGGGAVYLVGGQLQTGDQPQEAIGDAWCFLDVPDDVPALYAAGALPAPRSGHVTVALGAAPGAQRLLVIGGSPQGDALPYSDALLVPVDGCTCAPLEPGSTVAIPVPFVGYPMLSAATILPDSSVLLVGGARFSSGTAGISIEATGEAAVFVPDVVP